MSSVGVTTTVRDATVLTPAQRAVAQVPCGTVKVKTASSQNVFLILPSITACHCAVVATSSVDEMHAAVLMRGRSSGGALGGYGGGDGGGFGGGGEGGEGGFRR
eukprot:5656881-Prymnesium_polylepis.2